MLQGVNFKDGKFIRLGKFSALDYCASFFDKADFCLDDLCTEEIENTLEVGGEKFNFVVYANPLLESGDVEDTVLPIAEYLVYIGLPGHDQVVFLPHIGDLLEFLRLYGPVVKDISRDMEEEEDMVLYEILHGDESTRELYKSRMEARRRNQERG